MDEHKAVHKNAKVLDSCRRRHLQMSLRYIASIRELHQILAIANVVFELALSCLGHQSGEEGCIPFTKNTAGPDSTGSQSTIASIGFQHPPFTLNLQASALNPALHITKAMSVHCLAELQVWLDISKPGLPVRSIRKSRCKDF